MNIYHGWVLLSADFTQALLKIVILLNSSVINFGQV